MSKQIEVSDDTREKIKDIVSSEEKGNVSDVTELDGFVGMKLFIRTITYHLTGEVVRRVGNLLELKNAAWIADSGRFQEAIDDGELSEVEPVKCSVWVNLNAVTDMFEWKHSLPRKQK